MDERLDPEELAKAALADGPCKCASAVLSVTRCAATGCDVFVWRPDLGGSGVHWQGQHWHLKCAFERASSALSEAQAERERRQLYYLASPYNHASKETMQARYQANVKALAKLLHAGKHAFSPIVHNHPVACHRDLGRGWEFWRAFDETMLKMCCGLIVLRLKGWQASVGVQAEIKLAQELGLDISYIDEPEASTD